MGYLKLFCREVVQQLQLVEPGFAINAETGGLISGEHYITTFHEIGFERYEFVTGFDPDHVPERTFLSKVLGYFEDSTIGYVQAPLVYANQGVSFSARGAVEV
jgi:hypothetical protein